MDHVLVCTRCGREADAAAFRCGRCKSVLEVKYDYSTLKLPRGFKKKRITSGKYAPFMPYKRLTCSLGEGNTRLAKARIPDFEDVNLYLKMEMGNPTKTFKDRGSAVELTKAKELGFDHVCCASTGNMGLSVAHYARRAGVKATIFVSRNANAAKIRKIRAQGARLVEIEGDFNKAMDAAERFARRSGAFVCGDYHYRKEGQKTVAFEIMEQLRYRPHDVIFSPVGNGTLLSALYKGISEFRRSGLISAGMPKLVAVQSDGCSPLVDAYERNREVRYVTPHTEADAIAVGYPTFGFESLKALKMTGGRAIRVSDREIEDAARFLERKRIYVELGGASAFAGFIKSYYGDHKLVSGKNVVVILTGNNEGIFH